jgi:hydroxymethylpyrimidine pyrophosphatase-like HAD family hydrolase
MIKLLSTDFDGTLVDHFATPPVERILWDTLQDLRSRGVLWAVNTGRTLNHIEEGLAEFGFPIEPDFVLTSEREVYHRGPGGKWQDFGDWNARCNHAHDRLFAQSEALLTDIRGFLESHGRAHPIYEGARMVGLAAEDDAAMDRICAFLEQERRRVPGFHFMRNTIYVRFCHEDYSKGTALGELARLTEIEREEIFAAGDHYNDLPMLDGRHARWVMCPSNAVEAVKETIRAAGGYVAKKACSGGVVEALEHFGALAIGHEKRLSGRGMVR